MPVFVSPRLSTHRSIDYSALRHTRQRVSICLSRLSERHAVLLGGRGFVKRCYWFDRPATVSASAAGAHNDDREPSSHTPQRKPAGQTMKSTTSITTSEGGESSANGARPSLKQRLAEYGVAGVLAYGLLNTLYYIVAFLFFVAAVQIPKGMGIAVTCKKLLEAFVLTWAGSQVTKLPRLAGAAALAPVVNRLLNYLEKNAFVSVSRNQAAAIIVVGCIALAAGVFSVVLLLLA